MALFIDGKYIVKTKLTSPAKNVYFACLIQNGVKLSLIPYSEEVTKQRNETFKQIKLAELPSFNGYIPFQ